MDSCEPLSLKTNADSGPVTRSVDLNNGMEESTEEAKNRKLKLRREARRKRILENAKYRLEKLNGRAGGDFSSTAMVNGFDRDYSDPEVEPNTASNDEPSMENLTFSSQAGNFDQNSVHKTIKQKPIYIECRMHILFVAAVAFICTVFFGDGSLAFSLFIPVSLCIIAEKFYYKDQPQQLNPSILLITTLAGLDAQRGSPLIAKVLRLISSLQNLIFDIGIVIFFAVITTFILSSVSDTFIHLGKIK